MLHPSTLIRLATFTGIALLVRAIVRENSGRRPAAAALLPSPRRKTAPARMAAKVKTAVSRHCGQQEHKD